MITNFIHLGIKKSVMKKFTTDVDLRQTVTPKFSFHYASYAEAFWTVQSDLQASE